MDRRIELLISILICFTMMLTAAGCYKTVNHQVKEKEKPHDDAIEFGKEFGAVCRVGENGGDGTLIDKRWVLTAAHVARGMYRRTDGNLSVFVESNEYLVERVFIHPDFKPMGHHDVALLLLKDEVEGIKPMPIYRHSDEENKEIVIVGHGDKRDEQNQWIKDGKRRAYTNVIDETSELRIVFDYDGPEENPTEREGTSGPGDSGGPAFIRLSDGYHVAGVSSMGKPGRQGPATFGAMEYFVRVSAFKDWIDQVIQNPDPNLALSKKDLERDSEGSMTSRAKVIVPESSDSVATGFSDSSQAKFAEQFISAFAKNDEAFMLQTIRNCFAESVLQTKSPEQVLSHWPALFRQLQGSKLIRVVSESRQQIVVELKSGDATYRLRITFDDDSTGKISDLMFGKIS